jgi:hypothetical protein
MPSEDCSRFRIAADTVGDVYGQSGLASPFHLSGLKRRKNPWDHRWMIGPDWLCKADPVLSRMGSIPIRYFMKRTEEEKTRLLFEIIDGDDLATRLADKLTGDDIARLVKEVREYRNRRELSMLESIMQHSVMKRSVVIQK